MIEQDVHPVDALPAYVAGSLARIEAGAVESHLRICPECRAAAAEWETIRGAVHVAADRAPVPSRGVLDRAFAKMDAASRPPSWRERWIPVGLQRPAVRRTLVGGVAAAALVVAFAFTPIGSYAQGLLEVMRPQQFAVVPVTRADFESLPKLNQYGTFAKTGGGKVQPRASAAEAGSATSMTVLTPTFLPGSVTAPPSYLTLPGQSATFTFDAAKARAAADAVGKPLPAMPSNIDGASVQMTIGAAAVAVYGGSPGLGTSGGTPAAAGAADIAGAIPQLIIGQAPVPVATASGVSARELEQYLLSQPGISADLANAVRAIGDPTTTWPIPVPVGKVNTHAVTVQGVRGTAFSDTSGFGAGVMWVKGGVVYAVAAPLSEHDVLAVAESLR